MHNIYKYNIPGLIVYDSMVPALWENVSVDSSIASLTSGVIGQNVKLNSAL